MGAEITIVSKETKNSAVLDRRILLSGRYRVLGVFRQEKWWYQSVFKERVIIVHAKLASKSRRSLVLPFLSKYSHHSRA